jgi:hypothetical protein
MPGLFRRCLTCGRFRRLAKLLQKLQKVGAMDKMEPARIAETAETWGWLMDQVGSQAATDSGETRMIDALSLARSYVIEFALHRSLGASDSEACAATARRTPFGRTPSK